MRFIKLIKHLFIPHETNNQKAKLLHNSSLAIVGVLLIGFQLLLSFGHKLFPQVLGYAANISPTEVISLTNAQRAAAGLPALSENSKLSAAALAKGNDMLAKGYWAHFAPDGTSPWSFFLNFDYKYKYAGENLARDFSNPSAAVSAWMASPTHKDNILNPNYREIGIGVVEGSLAGADTTIIVQFFGSPLIGSPTIQVAEAKVAGESGKPTLKPVTTRQPETTLQPTPSLKPVVTPSPTPLATPVTVVSTAYISPFNSTKNLSLGITGVLLLVLSIDLIVVKRKRIARIGGRTIAHIAYLAMILAVILILKAGQII